MLDGQDYEILGNDFQAVKINLKEGLSILADPGNLVYMSENIDMKTSLGGTDIIKKVINGINRAITGENLFLATFKSKFRDGEIVFSSPVPGKVIPLNINKQGIVCQKYSYLCSDNTVNIEVAFTKKLGAGLFGGEGFILQKLTGNGTAFIQASGTVIKKTLNEDESIKLDPGAIVAFDNSVKYDIKYVGSLKTALFGGVGLFFATLTGPGDVYIQTLPLSKLSKRLNAGAQGSTQKAKE